MPILLQLKLGWWKCKEIQGTQRETHFQYHSENKKKKLIPKSQKMPSVLKSIFIFQPLTPNVNKLIKKCKQTGSTK